MGTATRPATVPQRRFPAHGMHSWDAFSEVDVFVDGVLSELTAMATDGTRSMRPGPKPALAGAALQRR
jgi:hypothetical protein